MMKMNSVHTLVYSFISFNKTNEVKLLVNQNSAVNPYVSRYNHTNDESAWLDIFKILVTLDRPSLAVTNSSGVRVSIRYRSIHNYLTLPPRDSGYN